MARRKSVRFPTINTNGPITGLLYVNKHGVSKVRYKTPPSSIDRSYCSLLASSADVKKRQSRIKKLELYELTTLSFFFR